MCIIIMYYTISKIIVFNIVAIIITSILQHPELKDEQEYAKIKLDTSLALIHLLGLSQSVEV